MIQGQENPTISIVGVRQESVYECNGCGISTMKRFFPDYDFDFAKEYLIEIDDVLYDGDMINQLFY